MKITQALRKPANWQDFADCIRLLEVPAGVHVVDYEPELDGRYAGALRSHSMSFIISSYNWWARIYRILQQTDLLWFTIYIKERFYNLGIVGKCQKLSNKMVANMIEILYFGSLLSGKSSGRLL